MKNIQEMIEELKKTDCQKMVVNEAVKHILTIQKIEKMVLGNFTNENIDPIYQTEKTLALIHSYNDVLTALDQLHRCATTYYFSLPKGQQDKFMTFYLLNQKMDLNLYDSFIQKCSVHYSANLDREMQKEAFIAFQSDVLKLIGTQTGYQNIEILNFYLLSHTGLHCSIKCSQIQLIFHPNRISQVYQASRHRAKTKLQKINFEEKGNMLENAKYISQRLETIKLDKPVKINTNSPLQLLYPMEKNLNIPLIKLAYQDKLYFTLCPRFISLHHELNHMVRMFEGISFQFIELPPVFAAINKNLEEFAAIEAENKLNQELNLMPRITHHGFGIPLEKSDANDILYKEGVSLLFYGLLATNQIKIADNKVANLTLNDKLQYILIYFNVEKDKLIREEKINNAPPLSNAHSNDESSLLTEQNETSPSIEKKENLKNSIQQKGKKESFGDNLPFFPTQKTVILGKRKRDYEVTKHKDEKLKKTKFGSGAGFGV